MWKWLGSWFAWRFSLTRLVVAVVFLGAFVGLNMRGPQSRWETLSVRYQGWPLPITEQWEQWDAVSDEKEEDWPWTHRTYYLMHLVPDSLLNWTTFSWKEQAFGDSAIGIGTAIIDILFALVPLALILFLHPRRKPTDEAPA
jgi:hypothetical protein